MIRCLPRSAQDCHVLTFSSTGSVSDHLVLHPQLATGNFIIKAIWLPGSQTELAIITADFVKVPPVADPVCLKHGMVFLYSTHPKSNMTTPWLLLNALYLNSPLSRFGQRP